MPYYVCTNCGGKTKAPGLCGYCRRTAHYAQRAASRPRTRTCKGCTNTIAIMAKNSHQVWCHDCATVRETKRRQQKPVKAYVGDPAREKRIARYARLAEREQPLFEGRLVDE